MADETVDALVLQTRFDESGLSASEQAILADLRNFANRVGQVGASMPPLDIDTGPMEEALASVGGDVSGFFAGLKQGVEEGIQEFMRLRAAMPTDVDLPGTGLEGGEGASSQQLRILGTLVEEEARLERQVQATATATRGLAAEETQLAAAMANQSLAAARAGAAARVQAEETLRAQQLAAQAQRLAVAAAQIDPPRPPDVSQLARGYEGFAARAVEAQRAGERLRQTMLQQGQAARRAAGDNEEAGRVLGQMGERTREAARGADAAFTGAVKGADRLRNGLISLSTGLVGVPPAISSIVSSLLMLGAGSAVVLGVAAGVAVIAAAYNFLTRKTREAQKATEDFVRGQVDAARARDPFGAMIDNLDGVEGKLEGVTQRTIRLNRELAITQELQRRSLIGDFGFSGIPGRIAELQAALRDVDTALEESARSFAERVFTEVDRANQGRLQATEGAIRDQLALEQQGFRAREIALRAAFDQEEITRSQFTERRIQLAREAAQAELRAIAAQRDAVVAGPAPRTDEERRTQQDRIDGLNRAAAIRRGELQLQIQQIEAEAAIADATTQRLDAMAAALDTVRTAIQNLPIDRFRELIDAQRAGAGQRLNLLPAVDVSGVADGFAEATGIADELNESMTRAAAGSNRFFREAAARAADTRTEAERLADSIMDINRAFDGVVQGAVSIGLIGENAARSIGAVQDLADSVAALTVSASTGNILGAIGSGLNLLGSLFGGESEAARALRENTEVIRQNTIARTTGFEGPGGGVEAANIIRAVLASQRGQFFAATTQSPGIGAQSREGLVRELERLGLSFEQLQRIANDFGIEILANGRLVGGALAQLEEEIRRATVAQLRLNEADFGAVQRDLELRQRLQGEELDARARFNAQLEAAGRVGADAVTQAFAGFEDMSAEELRATALDFLNRLDTGQLQPEDLGPLTREDLLGIVTGAADAADALEQLGETSRGLNNEMSNIPRGFRQAALAFESQDPVASMRQLDLPLVSVSGAGRDGDSLPRLVAAVERLNAGTQVFQVTVSGINKTTEQLFNEIQEEAERRGAAGGVTFSLRAGS